MVFTFGTDALSLFGGGGSTGDAAALGSPAECRLKQSPTLQTKQERKDERLREEQTQRNSKERHRLEAQARASYEARACASR
eukprot:3052277-Heterocapsa_arctica.AAC.1